MQLYAGELLAALRRFRQGERARNDWQARASSPAMETLSLLGQGFTFDEIARRRGRKVSTVVSLIASLIETGETSFEPRWMPADTYQTIREACLRLGLDLLKPIRNNLLRGDPPGSGPPATREKKSSPRLSSPALPSR
jgi:hypothetical protein